MKTLRFIAIATLITLSICLRSAGQIYGTYTNLSATNFFAASSTYTYTGANYLDMTRNTQLGLQFEGFGSGTVTNASALTFTYQLSRDRTNWFTAPFAFVWGSQGTNKSVNGTNVDVGAFGYVRPYQIVNAAAMAITNSFSSPLSAILKGYRRDQ